MKRTLLFVALFLVAGQAAFAGVERREHFSWDASSVERITIAHPVGDLEIIGTSSTEVSVEMDVRCSGFRWRCDDAKDIELRNRQRGTELSLTVDGFPNHSSGISVDLRLRVPAGSHVDIERGVGDTVVRDVTGDVEIEAGVGEIRLAMDERDVRSVHVESGVGSARLDVGEGRIRHDGFLFLGNEVDWKGKGRARVELKVGVGSVEVNLDN